MPGYGKDRESDGLKRIWRLLAYVRPYTLHLIASVILMATVGAMAALRILLVKPIFDKVLTPDAPTGDVLKFHLPHIDREFSLQFLVPSHFHNAWTVVAYALIVSAILKSVCDYLGTYLVNYAGFGMITDLRNDLYNAVLRRSVSFFQKHTTGTLLSTLINDIERVQYAMSSVLGDFMQQFFTLLFTAGVVVGRWRQARLGAAALCARGHLVGAPHRHEACARRRARARTSSPRFRTSCTRPSPATAS